MCVLQNVKVLLCVTDIVQINLKFRSIIFFLGVSVLYNLFTLFILTQNNKRTNTRHFLSRNLPLVTCKTKCNQQTADYE